ncbi:MAG: hypothetical protein R3C19_12900 [Planctomycetaceae bacterium]
MFRRLIDCHRTRRCLVVLFPLLVLALSSDVRAQSGLAGPADETDQPLVLGAVETSTGAPAAGAVVLLLGGSYDAPVTLGQTTADADGHFTFTDLPEEDVVFANPGQLSVWAMYGTAEMGFFSRLYNHRRRPLTVTTKPATTFAGRLVDDQGQPISGAKIVPQTLSSRKLGLDDINYAKFSAEMAEQRTATTDADGRFVIPMVPAGAAVYSTVTTNGFAAPRLTFNLDQQLTITLRPAARLSGSIGWPAGTVERLPEVRKKLGTVSVRAAAYYDASGSIVTDVKSAAYGISFYDTVDIASDGTFAWDSLPPGNYSVSAEYDPAMPLSPAQAAVVRLEPGQSTEDFRLPAERGLRISGRVLGLADQKPVPGATVQFMKLVEGTLHWGPRATTDADGRFLLHGTSARYRATVVDVPEDYVPLDPEGRSEEHKSRIPTLDVTDDTDWPDLLLDPAGNVEIEVVDERGQAVPRAVVKVVTPAGYPAQKDYGREQLTDDRGRFVIRQVALNDTLPIRIRTSEAISDPALVVTPGELNLSQPLQVRISPEHGFRIRCRIVDSRRDPIPNANVLVGTTYEYVSKWIDSGLAISGGAGTVQTDADGVATTGPLWPDRGYRITVRAEGFTPAESPFTSGSRGDVVELEPIVLADAQPAEVSGRLVDANGDPIAGAKIYSAGKEWRMASGISDSQGAWKLEGVAPDVRYVFADANGFRFGGATVVRGQPSTEITLRSNDSPPVGVRKRVTPKREDQLATARELVESAWKMPMNPRITSRIGLLEAMVRIDPDAAMAMSELAGGTFNRVVRCEFARWSIHEDPERAVELLSETRNGHGLHTALTLARELAGSDDATDRATVVKLAELARQIADNEDSPQYYPPLARLYRLLGRDDEARELIEKTLTRLEEAAGERNRWIRKDAATALAVYDYARARSLADQEEAGYQRTDAQADVAVAAATVDLDRSIRDVESLQGDGNAPNIRNRARLRIARQLIGTDLDQAIRLVRQCEEPDNRAQALGCLAVEVARLDQPLAWTLIDEALAIHRAEENAYSGWSNYGEGGPFAAALAFQAKQAGYPDLESVVWHVRFAARAKGSVNSGQQRLQATITSAKILALVDQFAARDLLNSIAEKEAQIPRGEGGVSLFDQWLQAWLLIDFRRGTSLLRRDLEQLAATGKPNALRYGHGADFRLLVAATPEECFDIVISDGTGLWEQDED